jgi:hypothetical protein
MAYLTALLIAKKQQHEVIKRERHQPECKPKRLIDQIRPYHFHTDRSLADKFPSGHLYGAGHRVSFCNDADPLLRH